MKVKPRQSSETSPKPPENRPRRNGFQWPLDGKQVALWVVVLVFQVHACVLVIPQLKFWYIPFTVEAIAALAFAFFNLRTTWLDPSDLSVRYSSDPEDRPSFKRTKKNPHVIKNLYCQICKISVESRTKHCRNCNKCIDVFDHHCHWLNTCIGKRNYKSFITTLVSGTCLSCVTAIINLLLVVGLAHPSRPMLEAMPPFLVDGRVGLLTTSSIAILLLVIITYFLLQLLIFHIQLIKKGKTTYDYILAKKIEKKIASKAAETNEAFEENNDNTGRLKSATTVATISDVKMDGAQDDSTR